MLGWQLLDTPEDMANNLTWWDAMVDDLQNIGYLSSISEKISASLVTGMAM